MTEELRIARKFGEHVFSADASMFFLLIRTIT